MANTRKNKQIAAQLKEIESEATDITLTLDVVKELKTEDAILNYYVSVHQHIQKFFELIEKAKMTFPEGISKAQLSPLLEKLDRFVQNVQKNMDELEQFAIRRNIDTKPDYQEFFEPLLIKYKPVVEGLPDKDIKKSGP